MNERGTFAPPAVGGSSLLVIFAVLCLTVFAMLGLSTVTADGRLSQKNAAAVQAYYDADTRAETILARLRTGEVPAGVSAAGDTYTYSVPISDTQTLDVEVRLTDGAYTVMRWQAVFTAQWQADTGLDVWDGSAVS